MKKVCRFDKNISVMKTQQEIEEMAEREYPNRYKEDISYDYNEEAREAFIKGYQAAQDEMKWISVEDRLPDEVGNYLVLRDDEIEIENFATNDGKSFYWWDYVRITHWMPLPKNP